MSYKIAYYTALENGIIILSRAAQKLRDNYGPAFQICARSPADFINKKNLEQFISESASFQLVIMHLHGGRGSLPGFDRLVSALEISGVPLYIHATSLEDEVESRQYSNLSEKDYRYARKYINCSGMDNLYNLFLWAANRFAGGSFTVCEPVPPPWEGIYHPRFPDGSVRWPVYRAQCCPAGRPTIGILFYRSHWLAENTAYIDALVEAVEKRGANALPIFLQATRDVELGNQGIEGVIDNMLLVDGRPVVDVLINTLLFSQSLKHGPELEPGEKNCFTRLGVPVLQGIVSLNSYREWFDSLQGLNPMDIAISIAMPEFDGNLITVPAATREYGVRDSLTGAQMIYCRPVPERVNKIAGLALKWARLLQKPNREKKVAVIFHNYPPRNDTIGSAFGLDSPASVLNILHEMKEAGYTLSSLPENSQALMEDILSRVTNDRRWASAEQMAESAVDGVTPEEYAGWHQEFPEKVKVQMANDWGAPPGKVLIMGASF